MTHTGQEHTKYIHSGSCYRIVTFIGIRDDITETIWKTRAPNKLKAFLLLIAKTSILTWNNLQRRGRIGPEIILKQREEESIKHMSIECNFVSKVLSSIKEEYRGERRENGNEEIKNIWVQCKNKGLFQQRYFGIFGQREICVSFQKFFFYLRYAHFIKLTMLLTY